MHELIVLAKAPRPGLAKTRLARAPGVGAGGAAALADAFLRDTVAACGRVAGARLTLCFSPADAEPFFRELAPNARVEPQRDGDLGARIDGAFDAAFRAGATRAVALGMDTPHVTPERLSRAFAELERADSVFGPATDGGYYLIGLRERRPELFRDVEWSTPRVLAQSLECARAAGIEVALLDELFDVDDEGALERLERLIAANDELCPHTARALAALGRAR